MRDASMRAAREAEERDAREVLIRTGDELAREAVREMPKLDALARLSAKWLRLRKEGA